MYFLSITKCTIVVIASVNVKIDAICRNREVVMLAVNGVDFSIIPVPTNSEPHLDEIGNVGDMIFTLANSDTLFLTHAGTGVLRYTVKKY